jgi:hypothetical protein
VQLNTYGAGSYTFSSVILNGNAMTAGTLHSGTNVNGGTTRVYYLSGDSNIASGNNTLTFTVSSPTYMVVPYGSWSGVDSATGASSAASSEAAAMGASTSPFAVTVTSTSSDVIGLLANMMSGNANTVVCTATSPATIESNVNVSASVCRGLVLDRAGASSAAIGFSADRTIEIDLIGFTIKSAAGAVVVGPGQVLPQWNAPGVGPNPARIGRQFAFMGSTYIRTSGGLIAIGSSGGAGGGIGTSGAGSAN